MSKTSLKTPPTHSAPGKREIMLLCMKQLPMTALAVPYGYEALGESHLLSMLQITPAWYVAPAYEQRRGTYGLVVFSEDQTMAFLSTSQEIDALCAMIEWCICIFSYWAGTETLIEQWRSIWWVAQAALMQQWLRMQDAEQTQQEVRV